MSILSKQNLVLVSVLLIASLVTVQASGIMQPQSLMVPQKGPSNTNAFPTGPFTVNSTGQATPIPNGTPSNATLMITANMYSNPGGQQKISDITGVLQIGSVNYTLVSGQGVVNNKGMVEIHALTSDGMELILHGTIQGNNVVFTEPQSKLASMYFLSLQGHLSQLLTS